jgi:hypothetical protein
MPTIQMRLFQETVGFEATRCSVSFKEVGVEQMTTIEEGTRLRLASIAGNGESSGRRERPGALACTGRRAYAPGQGPYRGQGQGPYRRRRQEDRQQGRAAEASFRGSWRRVIRQSQAPPPANSCACLSARLSSCSSRGASPPPLRPSSPRKLAPCGLRTQRAGLSGWRSGRQAQSA